MGSLLHETKIHGTIDFPYIVYSVKIPEHLNTFPRHWHEEAELIYLTKGRLKVIMWSETYHLFPGDIMIILPHAIHAIEQVDSQPAAYSNIIFSFSIFGQDACHEKYITPFLTHKKTVSCCERKDSPLNRELTPLLESLIAHRHSSYSTHEFLIKSNLFMIMHLLNQNAVETEVTDIILRHTYEKLKKALDAIQRNYPQKITVTEAAAMCGFSESHFMKLFRELTGTSFTAYLMNYRLELAASQLVGTNLTVIEIAGNCGFRSHSYFTRAFSRKYSVTPIQYRKEHQSSQFQNRKI